MNLIGDQISSRKATNVIAAVGSKYQVILNGTSTSNFYKVSEVAMLA